MARRTAVAEAARVIAAAGGLGGDVLAWVGPMTAATGAILLVVWLADRALERRVSASLRLFLYVAVLARLALPVDWHSPLGLLGFGSAAGAGLVGLDGEATIVALGQNRPALAGLGAGGWAALIYAAVALALLGRWIQVRWALRRRLRGCQPAPVAGAEGVTVLRHAELGPFVSGLVRPRIVLPGKLLDSDDDALGWVLRHELAHVRRRDPMASALVQVTCIVAWPILPVWIAARRIRALMEVACDESAVTGADRSARRRYGEVLLRLAELGSPGGLTAALRFGSPLRGRLRALGAWRRWPAGVQGVVVAGLVGVVVACAGEPTPEERALEDATPFEPAAAAPATASRPVLTVTKDGELYLGKRKVAQANLRAELEREMARTGSDTLLLRGDKKAMMGAATDIMGEAKKAGARNIGILSPESPAPAAAPSSQPAVTGQTIPGAASVRGSLDKEIIRRVIRRHIAEPKECYERQLARNPELGGRAVVQFTIAATGDVVASTLQDSTLGDPRVESCLVQAVRGWKFPEPEGGGIVIVSYPFSFTPGPAARKVDETAEGLTPEVIAQTIRGRMPEVKRCYERHLQKEKASGGRATIAFVVNPSGSVSGVRFDHNDFKDATMSNCISEVVRGIQFPPNSNGPTEVAFPFVFQASEP
jgi:TonB family protein